MNRKVIDIRNAVTTWVGIFSVLAPMSAAWAQANGSSVTLYGLVDAAVRHERNSGVGVGSITRLDNGIFTGSRWGLRGREQLAPDLAALFTLEAGFDPGNGQSLQSTAVANYGQNQGARTFGRQIHLGLQGHAWGLFMGRQYTLAHTLAARFQPLGNPNSQAHTVFGTHHIARQDNMLRLNVKTGGIDWSATRTLGEVSGSHSANAAWAVGAGYSGGPISLAAYVQQMKSLNGQETRKILGLGGNWRINSTWQVFGGFARRIHDVNVQSNKAALLGLGVALSPQMTLSAAYLQDQQSGSAALRGKRRGHWVSVSYRLSKRTDVYAVLDRNQIDGGYAAPAWMAGAERQTGVAVGLRHRF